MINPRTVPLEYSRLSEAEMQSRADHLFLQLRRRRSVRDFSPDPVPLDVLRRAIEIAAQAPSGANKQPWTFVLVTDAETRRRIREGAEAEERAFYAGRAPEEWLEDLAVLGTDASKAFLEVAPALIVVFAHVHDANRRKNYYVKESVGIAVGFLIAALHLVGLVTLTHTPSPMGFLAEVLGRPPHEKAYVMLPVGYPVSHCGVPDIARKELAQVLIER